MTVTNVVFVQCRLHAILLVIFDSPYCKCSIAATAYIDIMSTVKQALSECARDSKAPNMFKYSVQ